MTALEDLTALVVSLPNASLLTDGMKNAALAGALIPDTDNVWPGEPGYVTTYDVYFAALGLVGFLQAQPTVRQSSSEGTSVTVDAPNWSGLLAYYRSMSTILQGDMLDVLRIVPIPGGPHVRKVNMNTGRSGYGDVNTDLG